MGKYHFLRIIQSASQDEAAQIFQSVHLSTYSFPYLTGHSTYVLKSPQKEMKKIPLAMFFLLVEFAVV